MWFMPIIELIIVIWIVKASIKGKEEHDRKIIREEMEKLLEEKEEKNT